MVTAATWDGFAKAAALKPARPCARQDEPAAKRIAISTRRDVITKTPRRRRCQCHTPYDRFTPSEPPPIMAAMLVTGGEKSPADRFQKARYWLVTLVNHTELAGKRADADRLSVGWKIG
jgi:hypothetical protein